MIDLRFNRKNTKTLLKGSAPLGDLRMSKLRLDWLLDQNKMVGCIYHRWWKADIVFYIVRKDNEYRLASLFDNCPNVYIIEDIEVFVNYLGIDELVTDAGEEVLIDAMEKIADLPATGIIQIADNKIYLFDVVVTL